MDRPLDSGFRRRRLIKRVVAVAVSVTLAVVAYTTVSSWIRPSVRRSGIRTAVVERGVVEATVTAAGTVVPGYEHLITSPIESRVTRIYLTPGADVEPGQPILLLDVAETSASVEKLDDQIALKRNELERASLDNAREKAGMQTRREIKALELKSLEYEAERCRQYLDEGLFSSDEVRQAETAAEKTSFELRQIDETIDNLEDALESKLQGLDLEISILTKDRAEAARRLALATASSDRRGVLTWVAPSEGMAVQRGDELARIADLSAFRVRATISDVHAARVSPGLPAFVKSGDHQLSGRVTVVRPMVENGVVTLEVDLDDNSNTILRQNLRVDVVIVTASEENTLRVRRGTYLLPDGTHAAFVIEGDTALRKPVRFGITNIDFYQILDGLAEGDEVIISDMSDKMHVKEVRIR